MSNKKIRAMQAWLIVMACVMSLSSAHADDEAPSPDKSQYTLFNPVPDDEMRAFSPDRPTKSSSATTVDAGHFQYEADIVNWTYDRYNSTHMTTSDILVTDPVLKLGLTENTDLEFALAPFNIDQTKDQVTGSKNSAFGFGDIYTRVKINLFGNEGGNYALAIVPYVKAPTASPYIGNNHWEGGAYAPLSITLPMGWAANVQTEMDILENNAMDGDHANYQNLVNISHDLIPDVTGYVELWSDVNTDRNMPPQYTNDWSLSWMVRDDVQLDTGVNIGLNKAAPDLQYYAGISQRF